VLLGRWRDICGRGPLSPGTWPRTVWFRPDSLFGLANITAVAALHLG